MDVTARKSRGTAGDGKTDTAPAADLAGIDLGPLQSYPGYILARTQFAVRQGLEAVLAPFELRRVQFTIMLLLRYNPGVRPSDVAEKLGIKRTNMAVLVDELFKRNYLTRHARADDGRAVSLLLSPAGRRLISKAEIAVTGYEMGLRAAVAPGQPTLADEIWETLTALASYES